MPIANNDPYFGALPPPDQDPRMVAQNQQAGGSKPQANVMDDILQRMITQNLGQAPPPERPLNNWEIFAGLMHPELMNVLMARKQDTPEMQKYQAAQKVMPSLLTAYSAGEGRRDMEARFQQGQAGIQNRFGQRMAWQQRSTPVTVPGLDANGNMTQYHLLYDPVSKTYSRPDTGEPVDITEMTQPMPVTNYPGPQGQNIQAPSRLAPQNPSIPQPVQRPSQTGTGHSPSTPSMGGVQGGQAQNIAPAGTAGKSTAHFNPAAAERVAGQSAFAAGLDDLLSYQQRAHGAQTGTFGQAGASPMGIPAAVGQIAVDVASQHGYTQPFLQGSPLQAVTDYNVNMRPMLFNYVKQQTGVQFGMKEFSMYASQFPTTLDDTDTAIEKLGGLVRSVRQRNIAESQQFGGVEPDPKFTAFVGKQMPREVLRQLPPAERLRFIVGGGQVIE